ncbi:MAG: hypothetical protein AAF585_25085 [Verrucomicrobiota bacterium]
MNASKSSVKTWSPTRYPGLYKHSNGTYYVRIGSKTSRSLKTKVQAVALNRRNEVLAEAEDQLQNPASLKLASDTFGVAVEMRRWQIYNDASLKSDTKTTMSAVIQGVLDNWPGLERREIAGVS